MHTITLTIKATGELSEQVEKAFAGILIHTHHEYLAGHQVELNIPGKFVLAYPAKGADVAGRWAYHGCNLDHALRPDTYGPKCNGVIDFAYTELEVHAIISV